jgi:hypothetical protein
VLAAGIPVQGKRELSGKAEQWGRTAAREYQRLAPPLSGRSPGRPADIGRVGIGRPGRYLLAPSLTWSPGCTPAASWAACPAATRSGIIGPSPEGSMMPASSQV